MAICLGFFPTASCFWGSSIAPFFLFLNGISLYRYSTFCLTVHQLIDIWMVFSSWLLWIMMLWTFVYKSVFGHVFLFLLDRYTGDKLLDSVPILCLIFEEIARLFLQNGHNVLRFHQQCVWILVLWILIFCIFNYHHYSEYKVLFLGLNAIQFHFPNDYDDEHVFHFLSFICTSSLVRYLYLLSIYWHIFKWVIFLTIFKLWVLCNLNTSSLSEICFCRYFISQYWIIF